MQDIQELNDQEVADTAGGGNWMDDLARAMNIAEAVMYDLTHPD